MQPISGYELDTRINNLNAVSEPRAGAWML